MHNTKTVEKYSRVEIDAAAERIRVVVNELHDEIVAVYLFGSVITGNRFRESDIDIALLLDDEKINSSDYFDYRLKIIDLFAPVFHTEALDVIILNEASTLLKFEVIKNNKVIFCRNNALRSGVEVRIMGEYYDTQYYRDVSNSYLKEKIKSGSHGI